jgi:hypothetical protein
MSKIIAYTFSIVGGLLVSLSIIVTKLGFTAKVFSSSPKQQPYSQE